MNEVRDSPVATGGAGELGGPAKRSRRTLGWLAALLVVGVGAYAAWRSSAALPEVSVAAVEFGDLWSSFTAEGVVRGTEYNVSAQGAGRVASLLVREGQRVRAGEVLATLSSDQQRAAVAEAEAAHGVATAALNQAREERDLIEKRHRASLRAAQTRVRQAELQHAELKSGARPEELARARQHVDSMEAAWVEADQNHRRVQQLVDQGALPRANLERAVAARKTAQSALSEAQTALHELQAGPTSEQIAVSKSAVEAAIAERQVVESEAGQLSVANRALEMASDRVAQARAAVQRARATLVDQQIFAPADGVATRLHVELGAVVVPGSPVLVVSARRDLRVEAEIGAEDSSKVRPGLNVEITSAAFPGRRFGAVVREVMPVGELKPDAAIRIRIVRARIELLQQEGLFFPGMEVDVEARALLGKVVTIPTDALRYTAAAASVLVVEHGRAQERTIAIGTQTADRTEVVSGLRVGEQVVVDGKDAVEPGAAVTVVSR